MAVIRPPWPVTLVPDAVLLDRRIDSLAFRLLVLLHADTQTDLLGEETRLAEALGYNRAALRVALRQLDDAGYLVRRVDGDWQVVPWA